jgi:hypothetical protein
MTQIEHRGFGLPTHGPTAATTRNVRVAMSETSCCPYCGLPLRDGAGAAGADGADGAAPRGIEPLYREVRRIREIAEGRAADGDARRIAELQRQVAELRATVARLRGPGVVPLAGPGERAPGRRAG